MESLQYHRSWETVNRNGCVLYLPFWRYGANQSKIWDISGNNNHGTITGAVPYPGNPQRTSQGSTYNRGDFTATNAFFWSSLDLSPYAGTDLGYTPFRIVALDGAGKKAIGYIGAAGAGETLSATEKFVDGGFADDTKWVCGAGWSVAGGVLGALNAVDTTSSRSFASVLVTVGALYKEVATISGYSTGAFRFSDGLTNSLEYNSNGAKTHYYTSRLDEAYLFFQAVGTTTLNIDDASLKQVTDPPATAVHIVSSLNGTTRNWASIESGFDPNTIASWSINSVIPATCIGWYFDDVDDRIAHPSINFGKTHTLLYWLRSFANAKDIIYGGAANNHVAIDGTNLYYNAGATELSQAHGGGINNSTMIGIVRSGTTVQFFKNGVQVGADQTLDANNDLTLTTLCSYDTPGTFYGGAFMESIGFTRALSAQEIRSYFELTRGQYGI